MPRVYGVRASFFCIVWLVLSQWTKLGSKQAIIFTFQKAPNLSVKYNNKFCGQTELILKRKRAEGRREGWREVETGEWSKLNIINEIIVNHINNCSKLQPTDLSFPWQEERRILQWEVGSEEVRSWGAHYWCVLTKHPTVWDGNIYVI